MVRISKINHSSEYAVILHYDFTLHFSDNLPCLTPFLVLIDTDTSFDKCVFKSFALFLWFVLLLFKEFYVFSVRKSPFLYVLQKYFCQTVACLTFFKTTFFWRAKCVMKREIWVQFYYFFPLRVYTCVQIENCLPN